jgi:hypothetical protein
MQMNDLCTVTPGWGKCKPLENTLPVVITRRMGGGFVIRIVGVMLEGDLHIMVWQQQ